MDRINFHTHTQLCKHATGMPDDYCLAAVEQGVRVLGFSDHTPYPDDHRWLSSRMLYAQLPEYIAAVQKAKADYADQLTVLLGMECEFAPKFVPFFKEELLGRLGFDYIALAGHSYLIDGDWHSACGEEEMSDVRLNCYVDHLISAMETGLFSFVAHPDFFGIAYRGWSKEASACARRLCQASVAMDIPLEINAYGMRKKKVLDHDVERFQYPLVPFWEIAAEEHVKAVIGSDAHKTEDVWGNSDQAVEWAARFGVEVVNRQMADRFN